MCSAFNNNVQKLEKAGIFSRDYIPQLEEINQFLLKETGFRIKPVSGLLTQREFLNALGMRVFCSTQYIRHHSKPEYTPEPDIIHELLGHVPMFADPDFADLSHQIGLLSMGNTEANNTLLSALYWYTVEFGACKEGNDMKAYGAGIASSIGEIEHFGSDKSKFRPLNPFKELHPESIVIQDIQAFYYVAKSLKEAGDTLIKYGEYLPKPFKTYFNRITNQVEVDRKVKVVSVDEKPLEFI
jgi:phenylalanine-4-hydroxylase